MSELEQAEFATNLHTLKSILAAQKVVADVFHLLSTAERLAEAQQSLTEALDTFRQWQAGNTKHG